ncbi:MAG TPA: ABC transporter permease [Dermatophilaceae bacterium]|jgi:oligopeptide transport system permease protein|nr:ABC transporter permease [Dermatophilaceae bacterium]
MTEAAIAVGAEPTTITGDEGAARSLTSDAWRQLRRNPLFWVSVGLIVLFLTMAVVPQLFTNISPHLADLSRSRETPNANAWFGRDRQGYDIFSRCIYGARASIMVGVLATVGSGLLGGILGTVAGYYGGWADAIVSRIADIFFAVPLLLGAIVFISSFPNNPQSTPFIVVVLKVVVALVILGWPSIARLLRSSVLQVKPNDYVQAARALGATPWRIIRSHVLPNALAPVIVVSTINLGAYIAIEATLSFLGIGLTPPAVSWGVDISSALVGIRTTPHMLLFPSLFLSLTVLSFIMLGDAVRDAFDPKMR